MGLTRLQPGACCGCTTPTPTCTCGSPPCAVDETDLTLTLSSSNSCFNGTHTLAYAPVCGGDPIACMWQVGYFCAAAGSNRYWRFSCIGSHWTLQMFLADPCSQVPACTVNTTTAASFSCSPLSIQWTSGCPGVLDLVMTVTQ